MPPQLSTLESKGHENVNYRFLVVLVRCCPEWPVLCEEDIGGLQIPSAFRVWLQPKTLQWWYPQPWTTINIVSEIHRNSMTGGSRQHHENSFVTSIYGGSSHACDSIEARGTTALAFVRGFRTSKKQVGIHNELKLVLLCTPVGSKLRREEPLNLHEFCWTTKHHIFNWTQETRSKQCLSCMWQERQATIE